ncbi:MAG: putative nucleotidyltransferase with HDIG domain [Myxococcota bacterium]|jgi:putative nucleotidyltransferase with HDIG domain
MTQRAQNAAPAGAHVAPTLPRDINQAIQFDPDLREAGDTIVRLVTILDDPRSDARKVEAVMKTNVGLTVRLLRIANSPLYRGATAVGTVREAVARLGFGTVRHLALSAVAMSAFKRPNPMSDVLWRHSLLVATLTRTLMAWRSPPGDADLGFTAGLLHDMGKLVLLQAFPKRYARVFEAAMASGWQFAPHEQAEFGTTHAEVGAALAVRWYLDPRLQLVMRYHHRLARLATVETDAETKSLVMAIRVADEMFRAQHLEGDQVAEEPVELPPPAIVNMIGDHGYRVIWTKALAEYRTLMPLFD